MKYKAWDSASKRWRDEYDFAINPETGKLHYIHYNEFYQVEAEQLILCKQTPLKDYDGNFFWEGDIVVFEARTCHSITKGYCQKPYLKGQIFVIKWLDHGFCLSIPEIIKSEIPSHVGHVDPYTFWNHQRSFKSIGNVFDNPELIASEI